MEEFLWSLLKALVTTLLAAAILAGIAWLALTITGVLLLWGLTYWNLYGIIFTIIYVVRCATTLAVATYVTTFIKAVIDSLEKEGIL